MKQQYSYIFTTLFCLLIPMLKLNAQQKLQVLTPPPPNVSALGKFGLTPVDYFTGVPRISVPLFTVTDGTLTLPISMQYHAGGITVKEDASEIGLGWALNYSGTITTLTRGKPDFEPGGFWAAHVSMPDNPQVLEQTKTPTTSSINNYYTLWTNDLNDFAGIYSGLLLTHNGVNTEYFYNFIVGYDGQAPDFASDLYTITLSDKSYKFVFDNNFNPVVVGDGTLKIELIPNGEYPDWKITDEKGIIYYFTQRQFYYSSNFYPASSGTVAHLNTWHLSKIVSPTYGEIDFKYLSSATTYVSPLPSISEIYLAGNISPHTQQQTETVVPNFSSYNQVNIDSITTSLGFIKFIYDDQRLDLQGARRLTSIEERDNNNELIKKVNFDNNSYFNAGSMSYNGLPEFQSVFSNLGGYTSDNHEKRLKLNSISELDVTNQNSIKKTSFTYNQQLNLPAKLSLAIDHWGFYNGASNSQLVPPCTLTVPPSVTPQSFGGAARGANPNTMQANVLTSI